MCKIVAAMNMTLDGYCDHTYGVADEELHQHYADLLSNAGTLLYGRITYQLMEDYWPTVVKNPTGNQSTDDFAVAIQQIDKVVFSRTLDKVEWEHARLADKSLDAEVAALQQQDGKDVLVGSPSLIPALTKLNLIDEYQICIHPVIAGSGLVLFKGLTDQMSLKLLQTKTFKAGAVLFYYERRKA